MEREGFLVFLEIFEIIQPFFKFFNFFSWVDMSLGRINLSLLGYGQMEISHLALGFSITMAVTRGPSPPPTILSMLDLSLSPLPIFLRKEAMR